MTGKAGAAIAPVVIAYRLIRPLVFQLEPELAHGLAIAGLKLLPLRRPKPADPRLAISIAGLDFPSPVGLAAGFDKNAEVADAMLGQGFGFVEAGTLTPLPQTGNPRQRLFRLTEDRAVINRLGFNNKGQAAAVDRLRKRGGRPGILGINIGANKDSADRIADYAQGVRAMAPFASYLTVNISSPNTPGLRALQSRGALDELLAGVVEARGTAGPPVFLKVAPDLETADIEDIAEVTLARGIDGLIISNTTITRPASLKSRFAHETGGLSGAPLKAQALEMLRRFRLVTGGSLPLIGAGGISSAEDAYERIRAGASLVQLYSAMVYEGPDLARRINRGLVRLLERDGFARISEAVGTEVS